MKIEVTTAEWNYQGLYKGSVIDTAEFLEGGVQFKHNGKMWYLEDGSYLVFKDGVDFTPKEEEYTGASSSYYRVHISTPVTADAPYDAECLDIIEALGMTWGEANVFKATWRKAAARKGLKKKGNTAIYDAEKMVFFSQREEVLERAKEGK